LASRDVALSLANEAARDPSRAGRIAALILAELEDWKASGETAVPAGYLYAAAHQWIVTARNLDPEPLPDPTHPIRAPITSGVLEPIPFPVPFDALIIGVCGWCQPQAQPRDNETTVNVEDMLISGLISTAEGARDLFTVLIGLDGQVTFGTDGRNPLMVPASTVVGTRLVPRAMAWTVRRNQRITVKFRNITNVPLDGISTAVVGPIRLSEASVNFFALNLERP
jgi:hypothetical protein